MRTFSQMLLAAMLATSAVAPALALDYEAKPIHWLLMAPIRTAGAVSGAAVCGLGSGPIDGGWHGSVKGTRKLAGHFGDEKGLGQTLASAPVAGSGGMLVGGGYGGYHGVKHGWKLGWDKPFSRWSYITMEEK